MRHHATGSRGAARGLMAAGVALAAIGLGVCCAPGEPDGGAAGRTTGVAAPPAPASAGKAAPGPASAGAPAPGEASPPAARPEAPPWSPPTFAARRPERDAMVGVIRSYGLEDEAVLRAMASVPRHEFVPADLQAGAYGDHPLPIGHGQTISQPYIVAEMTRQLALKPGSRVLEVGTGSAYQAAVLTHFTPHVYTMEIVKPLAEAAAARLKRLGYAVAAVRHGDGFHGWPEEGPFDGILVTCAAGQIPPPLVKQLKAGGRMVIPVGGPLAAQTLMLVEKDAEGRVRSRSLMGVAFVPLLREDPTAK